MESMPASSIWDRFFRAIPDDTITQLTNWHDGALAKLREAVEILQDDPGLITERRARYVYHLRDLCVAAIHDIEDMAKALDAIDEVASQCVPDEAKCEMAPVDNGILYKGVLTNTRVR